MRAKKETEGKTCWKLVLREHHRMSITCGQLLQDFLQLQIPPGIPGQYSLFVLPYCIDFTKLHNELRSELLYRYLIKSLLQFETRVQISKFLQCDSCHSILFIFHSESFKSVPVSTKGSMWSTRLPSMHGGYSTCLQIARRTALSRTAYGTLQSQCEQTKIRENPNSNSI